jgi:hypothetical protein
MEINRLLLMEINRLLLIEINRLLLMEINGLLLILIAWKVRNIRPDYVPQLTAIFQINITNFRSYDAKHENCCFLCCDASDVWRMVTITVAILGMLIFATNFHLVQGPPFIVVRSTASCSMCTGPKAAGAWN